MAQVSTLKSTSITTLDAAPPNIGPTAGQGASGKLKVSTDYVTTVSADSATSTYRMIRIPSNAIIKQLLCEAAAMSAGKFELGVYYSDSVSDAGISGLNTGVVNSQSALFIASDGLVCTSAVALADYTNSSGSYTINLRNTELWSVCGLTTDPGGFFDLVFTCTTAVTTGAYLGLYCYWTQA